MLVNLNITNFILIKEINLDLCSDFNVFTGETGAGKSLFVDALNFVSGHRSSAKIVGKYGDFASVQTIFRLHEDHIVLKMLHDLNLIEDSSEDIIFERTMNQNGRSTARINDKRVSLSTLRNTLSHIIDIHSQHETQYLLDDKKHLIFLDNFISDDKYLQQYKKIHAMYLSKIHEMDRLNKSLLNEEDIRKLKLDLSDIESLNPSLRDYEEIDTTIKSLEILDKEQSIYRDIEDTLLNKQNVMGHLYNLLEKFESLDTLKEPFNNAYFQLEDISQTISSRKNQASYDGYKLTILNDKMLKYTQMIRKYGSLESLLEQQSVLQNKLDQSIHFEELLLNLEDELKLVSASLKDAANSLSERRKEAARSLESLVVKELNDLMLIDTRFEILIKDKDYMDDGCDDIKFMVSFNKGMQLEALSEVASGGELSRLMLGLKVIFANSQDKPTLIFDEIDTGVSGKVALKIAEKMKEIASKLQVISITHLPSVAAYASAHYLISKEVLENNTVTKVDKIDTRKRLEQLALMMTGHADKDALKVAQRILDKGV